MNKKQSLLLALFGCFTLFGFAPLEIYFSIYQDVWFGFEHIIGLVLLMFLASFFCLFLSLVAFGKLSDKWSGRIATLIFSMIMAAYIQGNFLPSNFGSMDGQTVDWSAYSWENVLSIIMWMLIIGTSFMVLHKKGREKFFAGIKVIMICVLLVQAVTLITVCFTTEGLKPKNSAAFLDKDLFSFSENENVIILVLDAYDAQVFQAICDESGNDEYLQSLDGFTFFPDTVGAYSSTYCAIPHILTGKKYFNDRPIEEYVNEAYSVSPIFSKLQEEQYKINVYTNEAIPTDEKAYGFINNYLPKEKSVIQVSSKRKMMTYLGKLVGIRYLPQPLKRYCWFYSAELWDLRDVNYEDDLFYLDNFIFDNKIQGANKESEQKTFHFYHIEGVHKPCYYDENFNKVTYEVSKDGQGGMIRTGKGILVLVNHLLKKLEDLGIYDETAIVIMADHGGGFSDGDQDSPLARANPLLLIKGFDERHSLETSSLSISYDDFQDAFLQLISGKEVFEKVDTEKERYYITISDFTEYVTDGHAFDKSSLKATGVVYGEN